MQHARLAQDIGVPNENVFIAENGDVLEFTANTGRIAGRVPAGRIFVDGLGVGDVGNVVLRDRKQLSQDGILIAIITPGPGQRTSIGRAGHYLPRVCLRPRIGSTDGRGPG